MMRFFVVETDAAFSTSLEQLFQQRGVDCAVFTDSKEAFDTLKREAKNVHLLILAKELGQGEDGLLVLDEIRKDLHTRNVPVLLTSSTWGKTDFAKHQKTENGANGYFSKSSEPVELVATAESILGIKLAAPKAVERQAAAPAGSSPARTQRVQNKSGKTVEIPVFSFDEVFGGNTEGSRISIDFGEEPTASPLPPTPSAAPAPSSISLSAAASPPPAAPTNEISVQVEVTSSAVSAQPPVLQETQASQEVVLDREATADLSALSMTIGATSSEKITLPDSASERMEPSEPVLELPAIPQEPDAPDAGASQAAIAAPDVAVGATELPEEASNASHENQETDADIANELPYLFSGGTKLTNLRAGSSSRGQPKENPAAQISLNREPSLASGASEADSNDTNTLKRYLAMREQDVSVLTVQLSYAKEELAKSQKQIQDLKFESEELLQQFDDVKRKLNELQSERAHLGEASRREQEEGRAELKEKEDRIKLLEAKLGDSDKQYDRLKERVRLDIRKIRTRERELENKLEILKKDSETLIASRENKILELKRKVDLLEFNYDVLLDKNESERQNTVKADEKIEKILKVLRLAVGIVEQPDGDAQDGGGIGEVEARPGAKTPQAS